MNDTYAIQIVSQLVTLNKTLQLILAELQARRVDREDRPAR